MTLWMALVLTGMAVTPVSGDLTATFAAPAGSKTTMKIEVAQNGNARMDLGPLTFIKRDGRMYMVTNVDAHPMVVDLAAMQAEMRESYAKSGADLCAGFAAIDQKTQLIQQGSMVVRGRTGDAWFKRMADGQVAEKPDMVVSHDPALAPIGAFVAEEYRASMSMMPDCPSMKAFTAPTEAALDAGTPILMSGMELAEVREDPIDPKRFDLPAPPVAPGVLRGNGEAKPAAPN
jgi:hypothetical protein